MESKAIINSIETKHKSIFNYIDMEGLRIYLIHHPHLLIILEFLLKHIDDYTKNYNDDGSMIRSCHI
jgi:hypothetical protein